MGLSIFGLEFLTTREVTTLREDTAALADLERQLEDIGWVNINNPTTGLMIEARESYVKMVKRSRLAYVKNPIVAQAVDLTTWYTFGEGLQDPKATDPDVQKILTDFWNDPDNRLALTAPLNQFKLSNKLMYDGELVFVFQPDVDGKLYVRLIDPISINTVLYDTIDGMRPLFYKRSTGFGTDHYFADYMNAKALMREEYPEEWDAMCADLKLNDQRVITGAYIYHVKVNNDILDRRGIPYVYRSIDWGNANNKINNDLSSFINAQAQYAVKKKVKGTRQQIDAMAAKLRQNSTLTNPSGQAGATLLQNQLIDTEMVGLPSSTGQLFETGIRRSLLMMCASFGIMEHYFGDAANANLATAVAMELPMLKRFQAFQKIWEGIIRDILNFQIDMALWAQNKNALELSPIKNRYVIKKDFDDRSFDIEFPPILQQDLNQLSQALQTAKNAQLVPIDTAQRLFLAAAGVTNIDEEMQKEFYTPPAPPTKITVASNGKPTAADPTDKHGTDDITSQEAAKSKTGTLYIVRHGKTGLNGKDATSPDDKIRGWKDIPLDKQGKREAQDLADQLKDIDVDRIYSSDLLRAKDTANAIAAEHKDLDPQFTKSLRPWNLGVFQGKSSAAVAPEIEKYVEDPEEVIENGESFNSFSHRFLDFLEGILADVKGGESVVLVTHYRDMRLLEAWVKAGCDGYNIDADTFLKHAKKDTTASVKQLLPDGDKWTLEDEIKEAVAVSPNTLAGKAKAIRLADKNKKVLGQIRSYVREIGAAYKQYAGRVQRSVQTTKVVREMEVFENGKTLKEAKTKYKLSMGNMRAPTVSFTDQMKRLGKRYIPPAVETGVKYVKSHDAHIKEASAKSFNQDRFAQTKIQQNSDYLQESLQPDLIGMFNALDGSEYDSTDAANAAVDDQISTFESRVGSYANWLWTVAECATKEAANPEQQVNFVGADDDKTCEGCGAAMDGNPWAVDEAPEPGDQDCLGNCRHALQLVGDDDLTEADKECLRDAQDAARRGYKLL